MMVFKRVLIGTILILSGVQCSGGQEDQAALSYTVAPGEPMVMNFDYPASSLITYKKSWFAFRVAATNTSADKTYTVLGFELTITGRSMTGTMVEVTDGWVDSSGAIAFELAPGATDSTAENIIIDGLDLDPQYPMRVKVKVIGWEGTEAAPLGRINSEFRFSLQ